MKVLITGSTGQLGKALIEGSRSVFNEQDLDILSPSRDQLDVSNFDNGKSFVKDFKPDWIINAGAYTLVDQAEDSSALAFLVNSSAPQAFSEAVLEVGGNLLQISTDYVFNGFGSKPYKTTDQRNPINVYGKSKLAGEKYIEKLLIPNGQGIIIRTSWLLGPAGNNFLMKILDLQGKGQPLRIISDQIGSPTSTISLAKACWQVVKKKSQNSILPSILHWSDSGIASWYDLAEAVTEISLDIGLLSKANTIIPIQSTEFIAKAHRPSFSVLDCSNSFVPLSLSPTHWRQEIKKILYLKYENMNHP